MGGYAHEIPALLSRRGYVFGLSLLAALLLLSTACGNADRQADVALEEGALVLWVGSDKGYEGIRRVAARFTADTGIAVEVVPKPGTSEFDAADAAGQGPDIWIWPHDRLGDWVNSGRVRPVAPSDELRSQVYAIGWDAFTLDGRVWGYPLAFEAIGLIYNTDIIDAPPHSFEQLPELHARLQQKGIAAIAWETGNTYFTWPLMASNGAYPFQRREDGGYDSSNVGINRRGGVRGAELLSELYQAGVLDPQTSYDDMMQSMRSGQTAMIINGPWAWRELKDSGIDFRVGPIPSIQGNPGKPFVGVLGAMITGYTDMPNAATVFVEDYLLELEALRTINDDVPLGTPANAALYEELSADPWIRSTMYNVHLGNPMPNNPEMTLFWAEMQTFLDELRDGRIDDIATRLDEAADRIRRGR
ncbi:maltose ABC transporter substrate-binding protein MalE [Alkalilimnicola ehrlichii]|nr:maltose ABC transporter substrate-binding protein MalE [Alkalilimnicola ehrlichii]